MQKRTLFALSLLIVVVAGCNGMDPVNLGPSVYGTVLDAATQQPVADASVTIAGRAGATAPNGNYFLSDVPRGTHTLKVTKADYATYSVEVTVEDGYVQKNVHLTK